MNKPIRNLKLEIASNFSLNMSSLDSGLEIIHPANRGISLKVVRSPISEIILAYKDQIKCAHCESSTAGSELIEESDFEVNNIRIENDFIVMELSDNPK